MKSLCFKATVVPLVAVFMFLSSAAYASPGTLGTDYRVSAQTWAENYFEFFAEHHLKISGRLMLPQVWLFSPAGDMVRIASKDIDPDLQKLSAAFPDLVGAEPLPGQPSSVQAQAFLAQALSDQSVPAPKEGHWYAVLILKDASGPGGCNACAAYDEGLRAIQTNNPDILDAVSVTLVLPD